MPPAETEPCYRASASAVCSSSAVLLMPAPRVSVSCLISSTSARAFSALSSSSIWLMASRTDCRAGQACEVDLAVHVVPQLVHASTFWLSFIMTTALAALITGQSCSMSAGSTAKSPSRHWVALVACHERSTCALHAWHASPGLAGLHARHSEGHGWLRRLQVLLCPPAYAVEHVLTDGEMILYISAP
jgi:hypothetical protein